MENDRENARDEPTRAPRPQRLQTRPSETSQALEEKISSLSEKLRRVADQLEDLRRTQLDLTALRAYKPSAYDHYDSIKQQLFLASLRIDTVRALIETGKEAKGEHLIQAEALVREAQTEITALTSVAQN